MLGAVVGDFVGSRFEFEPIKTKDFELLHSDCVYTDDTIMTAAVADAILRRQTDLASVLRQWGTTHITSYGMGFWRWLSSEPPAGPYGSWGNGSAMRVSPAAWFATSLDQCLELARWSAAPTHNHPEGVRGAQATAVAIYAARTGMSPPEVRSLIARVFGYDLSRSVAEIRATAEFELKSWISVPEAMICAFEATSFEDAIRNAVSIGADADTQAAIAGSIAECWFPIPAAAGDAALRRTPEEVRRLITHAIERARDFVGRPISKADVDRIPTWDPDIVGRWNREQVIASGGPDREQAYKALDDLEALEQLVKGEGRARRPRFRLFAFGRR